MKPVMSEVNKIKYFKVNAETNIEFAISKTVKYLRIIGGHVDKLNLSGELEDGMWHYVANSTYRDMAFVKSLYKGVKDGTIVPPTQKLKAIAADIKKKLN